MRPNPSDPERTVSVAIVATRLRSERKRRVSPQLLDDADQELRQLAVVVEQILGGSGQPVGHLRLDFEH
jgi:hypothetical protein